MKGMKGMFLGAFALKQNIPWMKNSLVRKG
jgi:hypothetical protein